MASVEEDKILGAADVAVELEITPSNQWSSSRIVVGRGGHDEEQQHKHTAGAQTISRHAGPS